MTLNPCLKPCPIGLCPADHPYSAWNGTFRSVVVGLLCLERGLMRFIPSHVTFHCAICSFAVCIFALCKPQIINVSQFAKSSVKLSDEASRFLTMAPRECRWNTA